MGNGINKNESAGTRTQDLRLKRPLLYRLSYTPGILDIYNHKKNSARKLNVNLSPKLRPIISIDSDVL